MSTAKPSIESTPPQTTKQAKANRTYSRRLPWQLYTLGLVISDAAMTGIAFWLAHQVRFYSSLPIFRLEITPSTSFYTGLALSLIPLWLLIYAVFGLYRRENLLGGFREYDLVFRSASAGILIVVFAGFLEPTFILARGWLLLSWLFSFIFTAVGRFMLRRVVYALRQRGYFLNHALVIGANQEGRLLAEQFWGWRTSGLHVVGVISDDAEKGTPIHRHIQVLGGVHDLEKIIEQHQVTEIIIASSALTREKMLDIFERFGVSKRVNLRLSSGLFEVITTGLQVDKIGFVPLIKVDQVRLTGVDRFLKTVLDYGLTIPGLILISPLLIVLSIAIRLDSPGPAIYRRRVMGVNGTQFDAFKFRTMHVNGDEILAQHPDKAAELAENHKIKDDPRVTRVGQFVRKFSFDELPQLVNVLRGEMSLVGPRMISPPEMKMYEHWGMNLLTVKPGLSGLWQVSGRSDVSYEERVRLDMQYIRNWTIWLDLQIILQTLPAVLRSKGAY